MGIFIKLVSIFQRLIGKISNAFLRIRKPNLLFAQYLSVHNSILAIGCESCIRGSIILHDSIFKAGRNFRLSKTAILSFRGSRSSFAAGVGVEIGPNSEIGGEGKIHIGDNTTAASDFCCIGDVTIGSNTLIAPRVFISSGSHIAKTRVGIREQDLAYMRDHGGIFSAPVVIGSDCWLGVNAVIAPGVVLGNGCVVGAGAVVTKSFPEYSVVGGVPAKLLRVR